jgi:hypothetical protein
MNSLHILFCCGHHQTSGYVLVIADKLEESSYLLQSPNEWVNIVITGVDSFVIKMCLASLPCFCFLLPFNLQPWDEVVKSISPDAEQIPVPCSWTFQVPELCDNKSLFFINYPVSDTSL